MFDRTCGLEAYFFFETTDLEVKYVYISILLYWTSVATPGHSTSLFVFMLKAAC
jgi:hypothetical protein